jgi:hypothetical protein
MVCGSQGTPVKWPTNYLEMSVDPVSMPSGQSNWNVFQRALTLINNNPSNFWFGMRSGNNNVKVGLNGISEVWFTNDPNLIWGSSSSPNSPAVTYRRLDNNCRLFEADLLVNRNQSWSYSNAASTSIAYGGNLRQLVPTLVHELGHVTGLEHEGRYYNIMGMDYTHVNRVNGGVSEGYVGEDASVGLVAAYGLVANTAYQDVSLTHWERTGVDGGYSVHRRVPLLSSTGQVLTCTTQKNTGSCVGDNYEGDQYYKVTRGQSVKLKLGYENNGRDTKAVKTRYYISTDANITSADTYIGEATYTLARDLPNYYQYSLVIPASLTVGKVYYIGAIIDSNNAIPEKSELNNTSYTAIKVY